MSAPRINAKLLLAASAVALSLSRAALAQNPAAAEALFEQARAAMAAGDYDIACARLRDSDKLDPAVGTRFNLADCEERRGHVATAWSLFRGVLSELSQDDDRKPIAEERAKALEPRMPFLTLVRRPETPSDARVRIDGVELGEGSLGVPLPMDPGKHELVLLSGGAEQRSNFQMQERQHLELPLRWSDVSVAAPPARRNAPVDEAPRSVSGSSRRQWAYVAGGVGLAGVALGTVSGIITLSKKSTANANCSDEQHVCNQAGVEANESGRTFAALSGVGFGIGVVGFATATVLWLTAPRTPAKSAHSSLPRAARSHQASLLQHHDISVTPGFDCATGTGFLAVRGGF
ncbi:MAG TPA: hypothetical protein VHB79_32065 [Polyangiaceae bacterium]|nr:hypothetical protein [Polyangiaceae bacterium]